MDQESYILYKLLSDLELPESAYEKAITRYNDLGEWLNRKDSSLKIYEPHIFPQGSFRLGTATKPLNQKEEYDLDLACKLTAGLTKADISQKQLKDLLGYELELYRKARGIKAPLDPKHRCWRIDYQDELSFHIDVVPCIPENEVGLNELKKSIIRNDVEENLARYLSQTTIVITDDRHPSYDEICLDWNISNPEGYASWFEREMITKQLGVRFDKAQIDEVPLFKRKSPLQQAIQLLKRHRDIMFEGNEDVKPISIIITTLATRAYSGETDLVSTLKNILNTMENFINPSVPKVPNPVNPHEDFADRWSMLEHANLNLEGNFRAWISQAKADFEVLANSDDIELLVRKAGQGFAIRLDQDDLIKSLGKSSNSSNSDKPRINIKNNQTAKPWSYKK